MEDKEKAKIILEKASATIKEMASKLDDIVDAVNLIRECLSKGGKVITCGNGGSAADAQHFAAELVVKYKRERKALPSIALTVNPSTVTAASNDLGYEEVFSRQIEAFGRPGDVLIAISTSGRSPNVNNAVKVARELGLKVIYLTGENDPPVNKVDVLIKAPSKETARVQEVHITVLHIIADLVEEGV